ncbi:MAG: hypothetical protein ACOCQP_02615 [Lentisphaeria bacterium]
MLVDYDSPRRFQAAEQDMPVMDIDKAIDCSQSATVEKQDVVRG